MIDINCKTDGCNEFVTCDENIVAVTCSNCCVLIGVECND